MNKEELIELIETYLHRIRFANDCFIAYKSIITATTTYNAVINQSPAFFSLSFLALERCFLLELAKLYKGSGDERTLQKLKKDINANQQLFPKTIDCTPVYEEENGYCPQKDIRRINLSITLSDFDKNYDCISKIINSLNVRRDKYIAHNDKAYFYTQKQLNEDYPLSFNDIEKAIEFAGDFCNQMLSYLNGNMISLKSQNANDLAELLSKCVLYNSEVSP